MLWLLFVSVEWSVRSARIEFSSIIRERPFPLPWTKKNKRRLPSWLPSLPSWICSAPKTQNVVSSSQKVYNYPRERMVINMRPNQLNPRTIVEQMKDEPDNEELRKTTLKNILDKVMCDMCARREGFPVYMFVQRIANDDDIVYILDEIMRDNEALSTEELKEREPWHLISIQKKPSAKKTKDLIVDTLVKCNKCNDPFLMEPGATKSWSRIPTFLNCGHIVCDKCERDILKTDSNECNKCPERHD